MEVIPGACWCLKYVIGLKTDFQHFDNRRTEVSMHSQSHLLQLASARPARDGATARVQSKQKTQRSLSTNSLRAQDKGVSPESRADKRRFKSRARWRDPPPHIPFIIFWRYSKRRAQSCSIALCCTHADVVSRIPMHCIYQASSYLFQIARSSYSRPTQSPI